MATAAAPSSHHNSGAPPHDTNTAANASYSIATAATLARSLAVGRVALPLLSNTNSAAAFLNRAQHDGNPTLSSHHY
jgi:hypothetical protein